MSNTHLKKILNACPTLKAAAQFVRQHQNVRHQWAITADYLQMRRRYPFLRNASSPMPRKKVLVVSLTQFLYQVKLEALFAKALKQEGCDIEVVTWQHCFWPRKYFRLFGMTQFHAFEDYLKRYAERNVDAEAQALLDGGVSFQKVKQWRFKNCRVGQQVLSTLARLMYRTPDLTQPDVLDTFTTHLKYNLRAIYAAEALLKENDYDILLFNEANGANYGGFFDLGFAQQKTLIQFVHALRDDAFVFKRYDAESMGLHPNSVSKSTFEMLKQEPWAAEQEKILWQEFADRYGGKWFLSQRNLMGTLQKNKADIVRQLGMDPLKKTAVIFSHVLWDANLFYGEDIFEDYEDWFVATIKAACANPTVNWVIKMHPANIWKRNREDVKGELREVTLIRERIGELPAHVFLLYPDTDINTFSLFEMADCGVTSRGTVGMELPCFGAPVLTAGTGRYSGLGFTVDSANREEYLGRLKTIQTIPALTAEQILLAKKYAFAIFNLRPWPIQSLRLQFRYEKRGIHPFDHNYELKVASAQELQEAPDLQSFAQWVLQEETPDYLNDRMAVCAV